MTVWCIFVFSIVFSSEPNRILEEASPEWYEWFWPNAHKTKMNKKFIILLIVDVWYYKEIGLL